LTAAGLQAGSNRNVGEATVAVVLEERVVEGIGQEKVFAAIVVEVGYRNCRTVARGIGDAGRSSYVGENTAIVLEQKIGARPHGHVQILVAVPVIIEPGGA